jgi:hypothetical protein
MRRTSGTLFGAAVAIAAGGVVAFGATRLHAQRTRAQDAYGAALHDVRREAARVDVAAAPADGAALCVRGPEGLAVAAARALGASVRTPDGRLDAAALATVSRAAFAAARDREDAIGAPAVPQRMGLGVGAPPAGEPCWASATIMGATPAVAARTTAPAKAPPAKKPSSKKKRAH